MPMPSTQVDEILDLVDENDVVIGRLERSKVYVAGLSNFRVINAFIVNRAGQLWIPRRAAHKKNFPLCLDVGVGGHVASGETYDEAFARELYEEVSLKIGDISYKKLELLAPHKHGVSAFMQTYLVYCDAAPTFNPDDFIEYYWLLPHEILNRIATVDNGRAKSDLPILIKRLFM